MCSRCIESVSIATGYYNKTNVQTHNLSWDREGGSSRHTDACGAAGRDWQRYVTAGGGGMTEDDQTALISGNRDKSRPCLGVYRVCVGVITMKTCKKTVRCEYVTESTWITPTHVETHTLQTDTQMHFYIKHSSGGKGDLDCRCLAELLFPPSLIIFIKQVQRTGWRHT